MTGTPWVNCLGVVSAVALGLAGLSVAGERKPRSAASASVLHPSAVATSAVATSAVSTSAVSTSADSSATATETSGVLPLATSADGSPGLRDASGVVVSLRKYSRVASASTIADALLWEFAEPAQVAAFTRYSVENEVFGYRYTGRPQIDALANLEGLLALEPDLLLVSTLSSGVRVERLRETGVAVFSLGEMRGVESFLNNARAIAALLGRPELGAMYAESTLRRLQSIARTLPDERRKTAIQVVYYGNKIYGSGAATSYNDVMRYAGLIDVGAQRYTGWPAWNAEQVLELDPDIVITRTNMGRQLCTQETLSRLRACRTDAAGRSGIVELPDALINDPGPGMLLSAERIYAAVYEP